MKDRILKIIKVLAAYIMLNAGAISWIEVSAVAENKLNAVQTAMAEIRTDSDNNIEISVLGKSAVLDFSFIESKEAQNVILACTDPFILSILEILMLKI